MMARKPLVSGFGAGLESGFELIDTNCWVSFFGLHCLANRAAPLDFTQSDRVSADTCGAAKAKT
jgi:hypothetical protein